MDALGPRSPRYGKEVGAVLLIFVVCLAYAAVSPTISALAFAFFALTWVWWRYSLLYVWERAYESGGRLFETVFRGVLWSLAISVFFTGCVMLVNQAYLQGRTEELGERKEEESVAFFLSPSIKQRSNNQQLCPPPPFPTTFFLGSLLWLTLLPLIYFFATGVADRYGAAVARTPLEAAAAAPSATLDPIIYTPPALRPRAAGWYPSVGRAWEGWGAPLYVR